jgi:hypothetical protein
MTERPSHASPHNIQHDIQQDIQHEMRPWWSAPGRLTLAAAFATIPRLAFAIEVTGLEHARAQTPAYLAISHKRDLDTMAPLGRILFHRGWAALTGDVRFAMRADSFEPGFISRIITGPRWFQRLIRPLAVGPILRGLGVYPLVDYSMRPGETWLREILRVEGDAIVGETLSPWVIQMLAGAMNEDADAIARLMLSDMLAWRFHPPLQPRIGPDFFQGEARRRAERRVVETAKAQLAAISAWLRPHSLRPHGVIYGAPEGRLSPNGHLSPITAGLHRILRVAPAETKLVPIMIVYDFMTTRRKRMFVDLAPPLERVPELPQRALDDALRRSWMRVARFTSSQLGAAFLVRSAQAGAEPFSLEELSSALCQEAHALVEAGRHVDRRLLTGHGAHKRAQGFLAFAARRGFVHRVGRGRWLAPPTDLRVNVPAWDVGYRDFPLGYAWNEYNEMIALGEPLALPGAS